jgi:hypothetical protein
MTPPLPKVHVGGLHATSEEPRQSRDPERPTVHWLDGVVVSSCRRVVVSQRGAVTPVLGTAAFGCRNGLWQLCNGPSALLTEV